MRQNHNQKRQVYSNKDFPSCMAGILNLFDFNHACSRRRLLTDKRHSDGLEAPRNSLDVSLEAFHSNDVNNEDIPYAYEVKDHPPKKKAGGMPMKTLIAQEMLREMELKHRTPGVIARLMGLDVFPGELRSGQHIKSEEIHPRNMSGNQQQKPNSVRDVRFFPKKLKVPTSKPLNAPQLPKPHQQAVCEPDEKVSSGILPFRDHPQEKQLQEFKKEFEAWQALKIRDHSKSVRQDELNRQTVKKQVFVCEKPNEEKMALVREKFIDAKRLVTDQKLQQSKEFLDALEVLQSNKDIFVKFLQEPNSLFARHPQNIQPALQLPSEEGQSLKMNLPKENVNSLRCHSKEEKSTDKCLRRQKGFRILAEKEKVQQVKASTPDKLESVCSMHDQYKQYSVTGSDGKKNICPVPTKIVILKPGPGNPKNLRPSPSPTSSSQSQTSFRDLGEGERASTEYFLQEVRERLKLGITENRKEGSRITKDDVQDQFCKVPKDPRQIARQIARQVRESVTRDLVNDPSRLRESSTLTVSSGKKSPANRSANNSGDAGVSSHVEISTSVTNHSWDYRDRLNSSLSSSLARCSDACEHANGEARMFLSERFRSIQVNEEEQKLSRISNTSGKMLSFPENKKQVTQLKSSQQNNEASVSVQGSQVLSCNMHELSSKIRIPVRQEMPAEWERSLCQENGDDNKDISPRNLLRSWSVPVSASTFDRGIVKQQNKASAVNTSNVPEMVLHRSASNFSVELIKPKNEKSNKGKVSSLKARRSSSRKSDSVPTMQPNSCLEIHSDNEGYDLGQDVSIETCQCKEVLEDQPVLVQQKMCTELADVPDMATEPGKYPQCNMHGVSPIGYEVSELSVREASNVFPISGENEAKLSGIQGDCLIETILPGPQVPCSTSPCSPGKEQFVNEDYTSEKKNEKGEQPSPVSVLDLPFQEEISSPKNFKEISTNLQELRSCLSLLRFDGSERARHESESHTREDIEEASIASEKTCNSPSEGEILPMSGLSLFEIDNMNIESALLKDLQCLNEKRADLLYIMNVLVTTGFNGNSDAVFAQWFAPNHPLNPILFDKIEASYGKDTQHQTEGTAGELGETSSTRDGKAGRSELERYLIFDCINEVLLEILGPFYRRRPWVRSIKNNLRPMPVGKQLLEQTWKTICDYLYSQPGNQYTLQNLISKDLARQDLWMDVQDDTEIIGIEVEKMIFSDLVEEVLHDIILGE